MYGFKFLLWVQVTAQGLFLCVLGTDMTLYSANIRDTRASTILQTAISERLLEKVHATILKGIVGGLEFSVFQKSLKEWDERPWTCLRVLKESNNSGFESYSVRNSVLILSRLLRALFF